jgi:hypothetical protein
VLQILWIGTHLGEKWSQRATRARHGRTTRHDRPCRCGRSGRCGRPWQVRPILPGAAGPAPCHVLSLEHFLPRVHNLDERDLSRKRRFDRVCPPLQPINHYNRHSKSILSVTKRRRFIPRLKGGSAAPPNRHIGQNRRKEPTLNRLRSKDQERPSQRRWIIGPATPPHPAAPMKMGPRPQPTSLTYKRSLTPAGSHTPRWSISFPLFSSLRVGLL